MIWQQLRGRSPAEYTGMVAIGLVVVAAWVYSITLEYSFFAAVTPGTNPMFPYLGLAFTGIGLALWGIGFACALKSFTQVMTMIMMLASGGTAVYIATVQFQAQGDVRYNIALDPTNYAKALTITGVMLLLNVAMLVLKVIVWRFSQPGTGFFERPQVYAPDQQPQPRYVEAQPQPKEERTLEQRATRQLPPAREPGTGFFSRFGSAVSAFRQPVMTKAIVDEQAGEYEEDEHDRDVRAMNEAFEKKLAGVTCANGCGASHVQANWRQFPGDDDTTWYCPSCFSQVRQAQTPVQQSPSVEDRKAQSEQAAKQQKQPKK